MFTSPTKQFSAILEKTFIPQLQASSSDDLILRGLLENHISRENLKPPESPGSHSVSRSTEDMEFAHNLLSFAQENSCNTTRNLGEQETTTDISQPVSDHREIFV